MLRKSPETSFRTKHERLESAIPRSRWHAAAAIAYEGALTPWVSDLEEPSGSSYCELCQASAASTGASQEVLP